MINIEYRVRQESLTGNYCEWQQCHIHLKIINHVTKGGMPFPFKINFPQELCSAC